MQFSYVIEKMKIAYNAEKLSYKIFPVTKFITNDVTANAQINNK